MMKLCWGLICRSNLLWVQCLLNKYRCGLCKYPKVRKRNVQSEVWKGITAVWDSFLTNVKVKMGNGVNTWAWKERWGNLERPLAAYVDKNWHLMGENDKVSDFVTQGGEWDIRKWEIFLPVQAIEMIKGIKPPLGEQEDRWQWCGSTDGNFSIKSAYEIIVGNPNQVADLEWYKIWRWDIPEKAKVFLWQVFQERIPTNEGRAKHIPNINKECVFECGEEETVLHTLRDCESAKRVWLSLINPIYISVFFNGNLQDWLAWNMGNNPSNKRTKRWPWNRTFGMACWNIWKNRCCQAFEGKNDQPRVIANRCIFQLMEGVHEHRYKHLVMQVTDRTQTQWRLPPDDFVRVDVDGSVNKEGRAAAAGIIRNAKGEWIQGFQRRLGLIPIVAAEMSAIKTGLELCKELRIRKIKLFSDSLDAISLILRDCDLEHPLWNEVGQIRNLIAQDWDLEIIHNHREALGCADKLAKHAHYIEQEDLVLLEAPEYCREMISREAGAVVFAPPDCT